jgi:hypothetical protein
MSDDLKKRLIDWEMWDEGDINDTREEAHAYIEELEAKLAKAVKVLEKIAQHDMQYWAVTTLAELKGEDMG